MPEIDFTARRPWLERTLDDLEAAGAQILVAEVAGQAAGFVTVDGRRAVIDQLAVDPNRQGRGIGSKLLAGAKVLCPDGLELVVNRGNDAALKLYARAGFREIAEAVNPNSGLPTLVLRWAPAPG